MVEAWRRVLGEGAVTAPEDAVVAGAAGRTARDPELGARPKIGEDGQRRSQCGPDDVAEAPLEGLALRPLVVHDHLAGDQGGDGRRPLVGEHDGVAPLSTAATTAAAVTTAVTGTCPFRKPISRNGAPADRSGARRAARQTRDGGRLLDGGEAVVERMDDAERRVG